MLIEDKALCLLGPGHDCAPQNIWIKFDYSSQQELGLELLGEIIQFTHVVAITLTLVEFVDLNNNQLL